MDQLMDHPMDHLMDRPSPSTLNHPFEVRR